MSTDLHPTIDNHFQNYLKLQNPATEYQLDKTTTFILERDDREITVVLLMGTERIILGHYHIYERCFYYNGDRRTLEQVIALFEYVESTFSTIGDGNGK